MQTHENLIRAAIAKEFIDSLAFFYLTKKHFSNSIVRSVTELSRRTGVSYNTCKKHIGKLAKVNFAKQHGRGYTLISNEKAKRNFLFKKGDRHLCTIKFDSQTKLKDIKKLLFAKLLEMDCRQQRFKTNKRLRNNKKDCVERITFTDQYLSKHLGISKGSVTALKSYLRAVGLFYIIRHRAKFLMRLSPDAFNAIKDTLIKRYGIVFLHRNKYGGTNLYQAYSTEYEPIRYFTKYKDMCSLKK